MREIFIAISFVACTGASVGPSARNEILRYADEVEAKLAVCRSVAMDAGTITAYNKCKKDAGL